MDSNSFLDVSTINDTEGLPETLHCRSFPVNDAMYESTELLNKSFNVWRHKFVEVVVFLSVCPTHCWSACVCIPYKVGTDTSTVQVVGHRLSNQHSGRLGQM